MTTNILNPFIGTWTYRSLLNDPTIATAFNALEFGRAVLKIGQDGTGALTGTIGGEGWQLSLYGGFGFGSAEPARFRGTGTVGGEAWVYDYFALAVPVWPNSTPAQQIPALIGSISRVLPHSGSPAGVVASFYAVRQS